MTSIEHLGAHLLGRVHVADPRDYPLAAFLTGDPLDAALGKLQSTFWESKALKTWAKLITDRVTGNSPAPTPAPTPPAGNVLWVDDDPVLDQGQTGHCVGFGWAQWGNTQPVDDNFTDGDGDAVYYECKTIDGEPKAEDGSSVRSGAKAMQNRGRLTAYAFAKNLTEVIAWVRAHGPVVFGTDWTTQMFTPTPDGYVTPAGDVAGGHCYVCVGDLPDKQTLVFQNSWGSGWAIGGRFKMRYDDVAHLLVTDGEACAAVELAV